MSFYINIEEAIKSPHSTLRLETKLDVLVRSITEVRKLALLTSTRLITSYLVMFFIRFFFSPFFQIYYYPVFP